MEIKDGLIESKKFTEDIIYRIKSLFEVNFDLNSYTLYSWGSVARREMGRYSDLDLIIISENPNLEKINNFRDLINQIYPKTYIDLLKVHTVEEFNRIANIDGTDHHAKIFAKKEIGINNFITSEFCDLEELWHIYLNLEFVYPKLFDGINLKFSPYLIKYFNFAVLVSNYLGNSNQDFKGVIDFFVDKKFLDYPNSIKILQAFKELLFLRNRVQELNFCSDCELQVVAFSKKLCLNINDIKQKIQFISKVGGYLYDLLKKIIFEEVNKRLSKDKLDLKNYILNHIDSDDEIIRKIVFEKNYFLSLLLAYVTCNHEVLENLRRNNLNNWYILYGVANNPFALENTLYKLMVPCMDFGDEIYKLYKDYSWRNIYLYVAKNRSSGFKIKNYILKYENSREMDILAANRINVK